MAQLKKKPETEFNWFGDDKAGSRQDTSRLKTELSRQEGKLSWFQDGKKAKKEGPTVLERVFDVLSRGQFASAQGTLRANQAAKKNPNQGPLDIKTIDDFGKGFVEGLTGKKKTNFHQVLKQSGAMKEGKPTAVAGFALDILLDPTTYVGAGLVKDAGEATLKALGAKAFKEAVESPAAAELASKAVTERIVEKAAERDARKTAREVVKTVVPKSKPAKKVTKDVLGIEPLLPKVEGPTVPKLRDILQMDPDQLKGIADDKVVDAIKTLQKPLQHKGGAKASQKLADEVIKNYGLEESSKAYQAAKLANKGKVQLKVLGRPVIESEKVYRGAARIGEPIGKSELGQIISKGFRTSHLFPDGTNATKRIFENRGVANFEHMVKTDIDPLYDGLTEAEEILISHAREDGTDLTGMKAASGKDLGEIQKKTAAILDDMYDIEKNELHMFEDAEKKPNYLYHYYKNRKLNQEVERKGGKKSLAVATNTPGFEKKRVIETLADAKELGLDPEERISAIVKERLVKHHKTVARHDFERAIADEFGTVLEKPSKETLTKLGLQKGKSRWADDVYLPPEINKVLGHIEKLWSDDELTNQVLRHFDRVQNVWKFSATAANPGHHIRNLMGDTYLNYLDGVTSVVPYEQARKVMAWNKRLEKLPEEKVAELVKGGKLPTIKIGGKRFSVADVWSEFVMSGGKSGFYRTETGGFGGKAVNMIRNASETREDWGRLAHFIHSLKDEAAKKGTKSFGPVELREAAKNAGARVRKYNIDYGDLTDLERNLMKRVIPFYTFMRKNIPLQLEMLAMKPGRVAAVPKALNLVGALSGAETSENDIVPRWVREMASVKLSGEGEGKNAIYWAPSLPVADLGRFAEGGREGILREILSSLSPALRAPIELGTNQELFSGRQIQSGGQYATDLIPAVRTVKNVRQDVSGETDRSALVRILNYLSGAGLQEVTENSKQGELRRRQDPVQAKLRAERKKNRKKVGIEN